MFGYDCVDCIDAPPELQRSLNGTSIVLQKVAQRKKYNDDGRVFINGKLVEKFTAEDLWQKLLIRSFAAKVKPQAQAIMHKLSKRYTMKKGKATIELVSCEELEQMRTLEASRKFQEDRKDSMMEDAQELDSSEVLFTEQIMMTSQDGKMSQNLVEESIREEEKLFEKLIRQDDQILKDILLEEHRRLDVEEHLNR